MCGDNIVTADFGGEGPDRKLYNFAEGPYGEAVFCVVRILSAVLHFNVRLPIS